MVKLGAGLNKAYAAALRMGKKHATSTGSAQALSVAERGKHETMLAQAKVAAEDYLAHFPPGQRGAILLGALASVYGKENGGADTAVWLAGANDESHHWQHSIAQQTIVALREAGLLDDIIITKEGLVVYPKEMDAEY